MVSELMTPEIDLIANTPRFTFIGTGNWGNFLEASGESSIQNIYAFVPPSFVFCDPILSESEPPQKRENAAVKERETKIPKLEWPEQQDPVLTDIVLKLIKSLWAIVVSRALQLRFPLVRTIVSTFVDPTEHEHKAVLRLMCDASVSQAIAFWDSLEDDLQDWMETLSDRERALVISKLGLRVHWA